MFLISLHRFIASLMPYYNVVSRGWKLPSPDRCSLSLASPAQPGKHIYHQCSLSLASKAQPGRDIYHLQTSVHPAQPGRDIYHFRTLHSEWPAQSRLLSQGSPAWLSQAKPAETSQPCLQSETGPKGPEPSQIGLKVKNIKILNEKLWFWHQGPRKHSFSLSILIFLSLVFKKHSFSLSILIFLTFSPI